VLTERGHACTRAAQQAAVETVERWEQRIPARQRADLRAALAAIAEPGRLRPVW
jgi:hypothetical protein